MDNSTCYGGSKPGFETCFYSFASWEKVGKLYLLFPHLQNKENKSMLHRILERIPLVKTGNLYRRLSELSWFKKKKK